MGNMDKMHKFFFELITKFLRLFELCFHDTFDTTNDIEKVPTIMAEALYEMVKKGQEKPIEPSPAKRARSVLLPTPPLDDASQAPLEQDERDDIPSTTDTDFIALIRAGKEVSMRQGPSTIQGAGTGVFADQYIGAGWFVCVVSGNRLSKKKGEVEVTRARQRDPQKSLPCYMLPFDHRGRFFYLDQRGYTGHGNMINHSKYDANVVLVRVLIGTTTHLAFKSLRAIRPGTELLYDYRVSGPMTEMYPWLNE